MFLTIGIRVELGWSVDNLIKAMEPKAPSPLFLPIFDSRSDTLVNVVQVAECYYGVVRSC